MVPPMFSAWAWGTYIFFSVFLAGGIFWVWFCLPETRGASLEEMDRVFKSHTGEADALMLAQARRDVGIDESLIASALRAAEKTEPEHSETTSPVETKTAVDTVV